MQDELDSATLRNAIQDIIGRITFSASMDLCCFSLNCIDIIFISSVLPCNYKLQILFYLLDFNYLPLCLLETYYSSYSQLSGFAICIAMFSVGIKVTTSSATSTVCM